MAENPHYDLREFFKSQATGKFLRASLCSASLCSILVSPSQLGITAVNAAETKTPSEWVMVQNEDGSGLNTLYVTPDAVKIANKHLGCQMLIKAPDWKVHCFQNKEKIEWVGSLEQFSGEVMLNPYSMPRRPSPIPLRIVGKGTMKGLRYIKYPVHSNALLLVAEDISIPPQAAEFISRFYGTPYVPAMPLYSCTLLQGEKLNASKANPWMDLGMTNDLRSGLRVNLETQSSKKIPYNAADFEIPRNYKRTADLISVTLSVDKKSQFSDMLDNVGFTTTLGRKKQDETQKPQH